MINATKLRRTSVDGYMLQLAEIKAYGTPYIDRDEAQAQIKAFIDNGGNENSEKLQAVKAALENEQMTQKRLNALIEAMLGDVGLTLPAVTEEAVEQATAAEYEFEYFTSEPETEAEPGKSNAATEKATEKATEPLTGKPDGTEGKDSYLGLKIAAVALAALAVGALAFLFIKRKKK